MWGWLHGGSGVCSEPQLALGWGTGWVGSAAPAVVPWDRTVPIWQGWGNVCPAELSEVNPCQFPPLCCLLLSSQWCCLICSLRAAEAPWRWAAELTGCLFPASSRRKAANVAAAMVTEQSSMRSLRAALCQVERLDAGSASMQSTAASEQLSKAALELPRRCAQCRSYPSRAGGTRGKQREKKQKAAWE